MILIDDHCPTDLDLLAEEHFNQLNPLNVDGVTYGATSSVVGRIKTALLQDSGQQVRVNFWNYLLANKNRKLRQIICGRPRQLQDLIDEIDALFGRDLFSNFIDYEGASLTAFGTRVANVFNYSSLYRSKQVCVENCRLFILRFCPYCNEHPITVIPINDNMGQLLRLQALHQLDHFYPQVRYPYLALSFFNLVPGCSPCNSQLKGEKDFNIDTHFNPFHRRFDDFFGFKLTQIIINKPEDVEVIVVNKNAYPTNTIRDFRILDRYNESYKELIYNLYTTLKNHTPKQTRAILRPFQDLLGLNGPQKEILLKANSIPPSNLEINGFHLGKLKRDIAISMGVI